MRQAARWRRALVVAAVVPVIVVAGCTSGDPDDGPTTATGTSVSPTPSPSPTVDFTRLPDRPAEMSEPTTDGAIAAATYVMQLLSYTFASGDVGPWQAITVESCALCAGVVEDVTSMREAGQRSSGYEIEVRSPTAIEISDDQWFSVEMQVVQGVSQRFDAAGDVVATGTGGTYDAVIALGWADGWIVHEMGLREVGE